MEKLSEMREEYARFLRKNGLEIDTCFYSKQEWQARGEPFGNGADLSLVFEGALYQVLNYNGGALADAFYDIATKYGYWVELGYAWSAHFYRQ